MRSSSPTWIDPSLIRFKITPHDDLNGWKGGNWDVERRQALTSAPKHRALAQRYVEGCRWEDTELFTQQYRRRFEAGESVRGEATMKGLLAQYYGRVDGMFEDLKRNGFRANGALPKLLIGRDGELFIGNQGNHRLAMAQIIGLERIAGEVICRHKLLSSIAA